MEMKLEVVAVPVSDVERAKRFYSEQVGFTVDHDTQASPETRIVQLTPPGSGCSIVISAGMFSMRPGSMQGLQLCVADVGAVQEELNSRGVQTSPVQHFEGSGPVEGPGGDWNSFVFFDDPDGNSWAIQQSPTMTA
jgi:catechol 2,3-dioxygenase-like lactoylglutathione lyase family enzyme